MKRVSLELGGKNPVIVMDDADLELALEGVLWGAFGTTGQRCTATSRLILHEKIKDEFIKRLLAKAKALRIGEGLLPETDIGPVINKAQLEKIEKYVKIGKEEGATLLYGGNRIDLGLPAISSSPQYLRMSGQTCELHRKRFSGQYSGSLRFQTLKRRSHLRIVPDTGFLRQSTLRI